ncbi:MAG: DNA repair protein RadA [Phycisphaerales bacterium]|nr:MAG: DNA repair protein RadA [Phycisphaerales bacterium]
MAKSKTHYVCRTCGGVQSRWMGKCPDCGAWDALEKFTESKATTAAAPGSLAESWVGLAGGDPGDASLAAAPAKAVPLNTVEAIDAGRTPTRIDEFDRVLGGGLVDGSVVLLGGDPGIGKSTLLLQAMGRLASSGSRVLYVTSEESAYQTRLRAERILRADGAADDGPTDLDNLYVLADTNLARILEQARKVRPRVMVIDSIQMVYKPDVDASPGSVAQLRRCCTELVYLAKVANMAIMLVGHVTKDGQLAGPKLLEHLVDAVLSFEGDQHHAHRIVRGIKNRFGTTLEVGLFEMGEFGLREVSDVTGLASTRATERPGAVACPVMHGTRALLVEIQALTAPGFLGSAKRKTSGLDTNRLAMLIAVLEKHGGLRLADQDVFTSTAGGMKVVEPAADLAIALAIAGAHLNRTLPAGTAVIGEVGLGGEVRPVHQLAIRAREAARLGYRTLIVPEAGEPLELSGVSIQRVDHLQMALAALDPTSGSGASGSPKTKKS